MIPAMIIRILRSICKYNLNKKCRFTLFGTFYLLLYFIPKIDQKRPYKNMNQ